MARHVGIVLENPSRRCPEGLHQNAKHSELFLFVDHFNLNDEGACLVAWDLEGRRRRGARAEAHATG